MPARTRHPAGAEAVLVVGDSFSIMMPDDAGGLSTTIGSNPLEPFMFMVPDR